MKKTLLFLTLLLCMGGLFAQGTLFISEITDPGDNANGRFVEIFNGSDATIDFGTATWYICKQTNAGSSWLDVQLTGTLAPGAMYVVAAYTDFTTIYGTAPDDVASFINNGDDAFFLYSGGDHTTGTLVDAYGEIGVDGSGKDWEYTDGRAYRKIGFKTATETWIADQWNVQYKAAGVADCNPYVHIADPLPEPDNHVTDLAVSRTTFSRIHYTWTDAVGTNLPAGYLVKASISPGAITDPVDGTPEDDGSLIKNVSQGDQAVFISGLDPAQAYIINVYPYSNDGGFIDYKTDGTVATIVETTNGGDTIVLFEDFELDVEGWFPVSDSGDNQEWDLTGPGADGTNRSAYISGFNYDGDVNQDWAFSPPVNLDAWSSEKLTFYNRWNYGVNDENNYLKLFYSTDYNGEEGMHNDATWTELAYDSSASSETWFMTSEIDISGINGQNVRFGFKYRGSDIRIDNRSWWVDEFMVKGTFTGETVAPVWKTGYPKTDDVRSTQLDVIANINEAGSVFYLVKEDGESAPNIMDVMMGDTMIIVNGGQDDTTTIDGLTANTSYDIYFIAEDALGNVQDTTVLVQATTTDPRAIDMTYPLGGEVLYVGDTVTITWTSAGIDSLTLWALVDTNDFWVSVLDTNLLANPGSFILPISLDAGADSVILKLSDYQDSTFSSKSGWFYLTDTIRPLLNELYPRNNAVEVGLGTILYMELNEDIQPGTGNVSIYLSDDTPVESVDVTSDQVEINDSRIVVRLSGYLETSSSYYVLVDNGSFVDYQGNTFAGISDNTDWTFSTVGQDLYFSEYIEGGSNRKALEIHNPTEAVVNLDDYRIGQSNNGSGWIYFHTFPTSATLDADSLWVIITNDASIGTSTSYDPSDADEVLGYPSVVHHNGNDARSIEKTSDGGETWFIVDVIGYPDSDKYFDVAGVSGAAENHTLWRKAEISTGNPDWTVAAGTNEFDSEWKVMEMDNFDNLGKLTPVSDSLADIKSFVLNEQFSPAVIDSAAATVDIVVALGTQLDSLFPTIVISDGAMIEPASGDSVDFSGGAVVFEVTAENGVECQELDCKCD